MSAESPLPPFIVEDAKPGTLILVGLSAGVREGTKNTKFFRCTLLSNGKFLRFQSFPFGRNLGHREDNHVAGARVVAESTALYIRYNKLQVPTYTVENGYEFLFPFESKITRGKAGICSCFPITDETCAVFEETFETVLRRPSVRH